MSKAGSPSKADQSQLAPGEEQFVQTPLTAYDGVAVVPTNVGESRNAAFLDGMLYGLQP